MANVCHNCNKGIDFGHLVSHAKNRVNTIRKPNLHPAKIMVDGKKVKVKLCTKCIRRADRPHKIEAAKKAKEEAEKSGAKKTSEKKTKKDIKK